MTSIPRLQPDGLHLCFKLILTFSLQISSNDLESFSSVNSFPSMKSLRNSFHDVMVGWKLKQFGVLCDDIRHFSKVRLSLVIIM